MTPSEAEPEDVDQRLEDQLTRVEEFNERAMFRSASRVAAEVKRAAKAEQRLVAYMDATFNVMCFASDLLEPDAARAQAVELIALLESESHARLIQPDFPQDEYDRKVGWMSTCAYDNLAEGTALAQGYNSDGMHGCISDGLQVCQRTGKLQCVNCFREYAIDVYLAADDLPLTLHQARLIGSPDNTRSPRGDRRWLGSRFDAWVLLLTGQVGAAEEAARKAIELTDAPSITRPISAKLRAVPMLETILLLAGKETPAQLDGCRVAGQPPEGEFPHFDLQAAKLAALAAACAGDHAAAITTLARWDRLLQGQNCTSEWFEVRLRLTAAQLLAGNRKQAEALAAQLQTKATKARDWLTLRRLERLMDPNTPPVPVPLLMPLDSGPFAGATVSASVPAPAVTVEAMAPEEEAPPPPASPLQAVLDPLLERVESAPEDAEVRATLLAEVLAFAADGVTHPGDGALLLYLAGRLAEVPGQGRKLWAWAEAVAAKFPQHAGVLNLHAGLGYRLGATLEEANPGQALEEALTPAVIDKLFRRSLDLDPNQVAHFARAGLFYLATGDLGEAERCLARGCRLDRANSFLTLRLADVYQRTDRPRDALMVLDTCLREGGDDPDLAWQAGMIALDLEQWDSLVTYLDRYEAQRPGEETTAYYTAYGLLGLNRPDDALAMLYERAPLPAGEHVEVLRACAQAAAGQVEEFRSKLCLYLEELRLNEWSRVPRAEMIRLFSRLWGAADCIRGEPLRDRLADFLLETGLAPDDLFEEVRQLAEKQPDRTYYRCIVLQPLDEHWASSRACLPGQENWTAYRTVWGVLAQDEDEAGRMVLRWQARCHPLPAEVEEVSIDSSNYTDKPGVVWQGVREGEVPEPSA